ncbi:MAG TPA: VCBS repeat-containing protein [Sandaracinaceae bacterium LLY-WYZ-13_1]|nr:VCBS repeat-containing protein [Sandaracinaceae bacterium LLY-WYZ-13_1]
MTARAAASFVLTVLLGCGGPPEHRLEVRFADGARRAEVRAVDVRVATGSCGGDGELRYDERYTMDADGMALPPLDRGTWAFSAEAVDADCAVVASACVTATLPVDDATIELTLEPVAGEDRCPAGVCHEGVCMPSVAMDAGVDASAPRDAGTDAAVDAGPAIPEPPAVVAPWNGVATGSARVAADATIVAHPLRPRFVWEPAEGARSHVVEIVACAEHDRTRCDFTSPVARLVTDGSTGSARPDAPLPVETETPPLGRRFVFRVGACALPAGRACAFAEPRYVDVGRVRQDVDGDGRGDLFTVVEPSSGDTELRHYPSSGRFGEVVLTLPELAAVTWIGDYDADGVGELAVITGEGAARRVRFLDELTDSGSTVADARHLVRAGDVDGDGYGDFAFVADGRVRVQLGGAVWDADRSVEIRAPAGLVEHAVAVAAAGDQDGDGHADLAVVSRIGADRVRVDFYSLAARAPVRVGMAPELSTGEVGIPPFWPVFVASGYDVDGNGRPDLAVALPVRDEMVLVLDDGSRDTLEGIGSEYTAAIDMGPLDGSDRARIALGASERTHDELGAIGGIYHVSYEDDGFSWTWVLVYNEDRFGAEIATVDLAGDGYEDLVSLAATGASLHIGGFTETDVGGHGSFKLAPSGGSFVTMTR